MTDSGNVKGNCPVRCVVMCCQYRATVKQVLRITPFRKWFLWHLTHGSLNWDQIKKQCSQITRKMGMRVEQIKETSLLNFLWVRSQTASHSRPVNFTHGHSLSLWHLKRFFTLSFHIKVLHIKISMHLSTIYLNKVHVYKKRVCVQNSIFHLLSFDHAIVPFFKWFKSSLWSIMKS